MNLFGIYEYEIFDRSKNFIHFIEFYFIIDAQTHYNSQFSSQLYGQKFAIVGQINSNT